MREIKRKKDTGEAGNGGQFGTTHREEAEVQVLSGTAQRPRGSDGTFLTPGSAPKPWAPYEGIGSLDDDFDRLSADRAEEVGKATFRAYAAMRARSADGEDVEEVADEELMLANDAHAPALQLASGTGDDADAEMSAFAQTWQMSLGEHDEHGQMLDEVERDRRLAPLRSPMSEDARRVYTDTFEQTWAALDPHARENFARLGYGMYAEQSAREQIEAEIDGYGPYGAGTIHAGDSIMSTTPGTETPQWDRIAGF